MGMLVTKSVLVLVVCIQLSLPMPALLALLNHLELEEHLTTTENNSREKNFKEDVLSFETFANDKEKSLTVQSDNLAEEMRKLENQVQAKEKEEEYLKKEIEIRSNYPGWKVSETEEDAIDDMLKTVDDSKPNEEALADMLKTADDPKPDEEAIADMLKTAEDPKPLTTDNVSSYFM